MSPTAISHWNLQPQQRTFRAEFDSEKGYIPGAVSPDQTLAVVWNGAGSVSVVRLSDGKQLHTISELESPRVVAMSWDSKRIAVGESLVWISIYDLQNVDEPVLRLGPVEDRLFSMAFSPDGNGLLSGSLADLIYWDLETGTGTELRGHLKNLARSVAISPDGRTAASVGNKIKLWNLDTLREVVTLPWPEREINAALKFDPTGNLLFGFILDSRSAGEFRVWRAPPFEEIKASRPVPLVWKEPS